MSEPKPEVKWNKDATIGLIILLAIVGGIIYLFGRPWTCEEARAIQDALDQKRDKWVNEGDTDSLFLTWDEKQKNDKNVVRLCKEQ